METTPILFLISVKWDKECKFTRMVMAPNRCSTSIPADHFVDNTEMSQGQASFFSTIDENLVHFFLIYIIHLSISLGWEEITKVSVLTYF